MKINQKNFEKELNKIFFFEKSPKIAVAVSGGPDSIALIFLLHKWAKDNDADLIGLIFDHRIREESITESKFIKTYLANLKIKTTILRATKENVVKKTMKEARDNRFKKLTNYCRIKNIFHLFIAHHHDDNLETYLLRMVAGSNLEGLSSIKDITVSNNVRILRPLLNFKKKDILLYLKKNNIFYVTDPSNTKFNYSRVIIRDFIKNNPKHFKNIENDLNKIKKIMPIYKKMIYQNFNKINIKSSHNNILVNNLIFKKINKEVRIKIIEIIYRFLKPKKDGLRYKKIINFISEIDEKGDSRSNLGGMTIKKDDIVISFSV